MIIFPDNRNDTIMENEQNKELNTLAGQYGNPFAFA